MKKIILIAFALLLMASAAFAGVGYRYQLLAPGVTIPSGDSTLALITGTAEALDLKQFARKYPGLAYIQWVTVLSVADADVDTTQWIFQISPDGTNWTTKTTTYTAFATTAGAAKSSGRMLVDTLYQYARVIGKVHGDDAGTAIQTVVFTTYLYLYDGLGQVLDMIKDPPIECSFQE